MSGITPETQKLSTSARVDLPADPSLFAKFRCHPTIPCDIPRSDDDLHALWYHVPDDLLPTNWSSDWFEIFQNWFLPCSNYSMGSVDILLKTNYRIQYPIKGVMFCTVDRIEPGGLFEEEQPPGNPECIVFQDAVGDYYFYYEFSQGGDEYVAKFRAPRGTTVSDFVRDHFRGLEGVDHWIWYYLKIQASGLDSCFSEIHLHERRLGRLRKEAQAQSLCACQYASQEDKLKTLKPVS